MSHATISDGFRQISRRDGIFQERVHEACRNVLEFHYNLEQYLLRASQTHGRSHTQNA